MDKVGWHRGCRHDVGRLRQHAVSLGLAGGFLASSALGVDPIGRSNAALPAPGPARKSSRSSGMTMVEIVVAILIITVGLLGAAGVTAKCSDLQRSTNAYVEAQNTARDVLERIRKGNLVAQFQAFSAAPDFVQQGQQVEVRFPEDLLVRILGAAVPATARFRDTNGDGEVDLNAASAEPASLLPVRITLREGTLVYRLECVLTEI